MRKNFAQQRDDERRENKCSYAGKDRIRQEREQHVIRNIAPQQVAKVKLESFRNASKPGPAREPGFHEMRQYGIAQQNQAEVVQ